MKKTKKLFYVVLASTLLTLTACGNQSTTPPPQVSSGSISDTSGNQDASYTITIGLNGSEDHVFVKGVRILEQKLEENSGGRIQVEVFPNSMLGAEREMIEQVISGSLNVFVGAADGATPAWVPDTQIFTVPYLFSSTEDARNATDNFLFDYLQPKFEEVGMVNFGFFELGFRHFTNNKRPIENASDMQGLLIRVQESAAWQTLMDELGSTATPMAINELYGAMQQGVVDGQENPLSTIVAQKFYEVQDYLVLDGHTYCAGAILMNKDFYDSMSAADQELFQKCVNETVIEQRALVTEGEAEYLKICKENGMAVVENPDLESFQIATAGFGETEAVQALFDTSLIQQVKDFVANN